MPVMLQGEATAMLRLIDGMAAAKAEDDNVGGRPVVNGCLLL